MTFILHSHMKKLMRFHTHIMYWYKFNIDSVYGLLCKRIIFFVYVNQIQLGSLLVVSMVLTLRKSDRMAFVCVELHKALSILICKVVSRYVAQQSMHKVNPRLNKSSKEIHFGISRNSSTRRTLTSWVLMIPGQHSSLETLVPQPKSQRQKET